MDELVGVIPAAGRGIRAYPSVRYTPKVMLEIGGKPVLQRNLEIMRDKLGIKKVFIIISYLGNVIKKYFGDGSKFNLKIKYIEQKELKGIGHAISLLERYINSHFFVILGDEVYIDSNHEKLLPLLKKNFSAICGFKKTDNLELIRSNYSAEFKGNKIVSLMEKPHVVKNNYLGCGTYVFTKSIFDCIRKTPPSTLRGEIEITDVINNLAQTKSNVFRFLLKGRYINVNTIEDLNTANYLWRENMFDKYKLSVIIPAYNEENSIGSVIKDFKRERVDEILVVDNKSTDNTAKIAKSLGARVVFEAKSGYGNALKKGMDEARGDILLLVEADGSFKSKDMGKILEYLKDADMVIGTRTTRQMIEQGANMDWFLRWGNVFLGKLIEILWWGQEPRFTDAGCTYRGIWKDVYLKIRDDLKHGGPEFSPEMMMSILRARRRVIEIPVSYYKRIGGESKYSLNRVKNIKTGLRMLSLIFRKRFFD